MVDSAGVVESTIWSTSAQCSPMDPFAILGIAPGAADRELSAAYRELAKRWHPDQGGGEEAARRMAEINAAYDLLLAGAMHQSAAAKAPPRAGPRRGAWLPDAGRRGPRPGAAPAPPAARGGPPPP